MAKKKIEQGGRTDWEALDRLSQEEVDARAEADLDNPPFTEDELAALQRDGKIRFPGTTVRHGERLAYYHEYGHDPPGHHGGGVRHL